MRVASLGALSEFKNSSIYFFTFESMPFCLDRISVRLRVSAGNGAAIIVLCVKNLPNPLGAKEAGSVNFMKFPKMEIRWAYS